MPASLIPDEASVKLATEIYQKWKQGASKSGLEREYWDDGSSHGKRFDRFVTNNLGTVPITKKKHVKASSQSSQQLEFDFTHYIIRESVDRSHAQVLLGDVHLVIRQITDDPELPRAAALILETIVLPKLSALHELLAVGTNDEMENASNIQRARYVLDEILAATRTFVEVGKFAGLGFAGTVTTLAQLEPAVRGIRTLIGN